MWWRMLYAPRIESTSVDRNIKKTDNKSLVISFWKFLVTRFSANLRELHMESVHNTETVQAVSSSSVENMTIRVHSRLQPQPENTQESDRSAMDESEADSQTAGEQTGGSQGCESFDASPVEEDQSQVATPRAHDATAGGDDRVSKRDLVSLLEGFVRIIKTDEGETGGATGTGTGIELSRDRGLMINEARVDDRPVEIDQLRGLVIEAQDTIIKLLTDRVEDRSRIATLEAQLNLLPDLQAQADRAMSVAVRTDEYRTELTKMKFELDRFRLFRVRVEAEQKKGSVFNRIQKWLFSRPNARDETLQRNTYQKMVDQSHMQPNIQPVGQTNIQSNS
jgi:hypothetical protein